MTSTPVRAEVSTPPRSLIRPEIQALRAAAVLGVVVFHLWPGRLTGGYAGVDVFFVISGFLITAHLMKEASATGRVRLREFWARRIRRLLPAGLAVLAATVVAVVVWVPQSQWRQQLMEVIASATYWENWRLAAESVDYLGAENSPAAAQHYWSLSVEEQFYIVWPLLLVAALAFARRRRVTVKRTFVVVLWVLAGASFAFSVWMTATNPSAAYFVTPTRVWEFAAGGLLALVAARDDARFPVAKVVAQVAGWAAIAATFLLYSSATPFPGYTALLPVLGTVAVIWAGSSVTRSPLTKVGAWRPVQFTGDISYSLYLWHWPLIVIFPFAVGHKAGLVENLALLVAGFALAYGTKVLVEDPARQSRLLSAHPWASYLFAILAMAAVCVPAAWGIGRVGAAQDDSARVTEELLAKDASCFGASAFLDGVQPCVNPELDGTLVPSLASRKDDTGIAYECYDPSPSADLMTCTYGPAGAGTRAALVGNSHAAMLLPGLVDNLEEADWSLDVYVSRGCEWSAVRGIAECDPHRDALQEALEDGDYDFVMVGMLRAQPDWNVTPAEIAAGQAQAWAPVLAEGTEVYAVADSPTLPGATLQCLDAAEKRADLSPCAMTDEQAWALPDPLFDAVETAGAGASIVDLRDAYCFDGVCPMEIGNVVTYRDQHHITATFSKTLGPYLVAEIQRQREGMAN